MLKNYDCSKWKEFVSMQDDALIKFCDVKFVKGSGKGGQKRNKTSNKVHLSFFHFQVMDESSRFRELNKTLALRKLRIKISLDLSSPQNCHRPKPDKYYIQNHEILQLRSIKPNRPEYPFFCGWLLDSFIFIGFDWEALSAFTNFSTSQLTKWFLANPDVKQKLLEAKSVLADS